MHTRFKFSTLGDFELLTPPKPSTQSMSFAWLLPAKLMTIAARLEGVAVVMRMAPYRHTDNMLKWSLVVFDHAHELAVVVVVVDRASTISSQVEIKQLGM